MMNKTQAEVRRIQQCPENFEYKGHVFSTWKERMSDNVKIYHEIKTPEGKVEHMPWSPYDMPTVSEVKMFIDLGCPRGAQTGNFTPELLLEAYKTKFGKKELG
jgi:hypothetical protein